MPVVYKIKFSDLWDPEWMCHLSEDWCQRAELIAQTLHKRCEELEFFGLTPEECKGKNFWLLDKATGVVCAGWVTGALYLSPVYGANVGEIACYLFAR